MADQVMPVIPAKDNYTGAWDVTEFSLEDKTVNAVYTAIEYTFTFMNGSEKVSDVKFTTEIMADQKFPAVPAKDNYTGAWDVTEFSLEDRTVNAVFTYVVPSSSGKDVVVDLDVDSFTMPSEKKDTVTVNLGDDVSVKVADASGLADKKVTTKLDKVANSTGIDGTAYEFTFEVDGTEYAGTMQVTVPYTPVDGKSPVVYFYDNGVKESMKILSSDEDSVTFETSHNSTYVVTSESSSESDDNTLITFAVILVVIVAFCVGMVFFIKRAGKA